MRSELINNLYFKGKKTPRGFNRREFLKHLGGGIVVVYTMGNMTLMQACSRKEEEKMEDFNAYLKDRNGPGRYYQPCHGACRRA